VDLIDPVIDWTPYGFAEGAALVTVAQSCKVTVPPSGSMLTLLLLDKLPLETEDARRSKVMAPDAIVGMTITEPTIARLKAVYFDFI